MYQLCKKSTKAKQIQFIATAGSDLFKYLVASALSIPAFVWDAGPLPAATTANGIGWI
jgi:hypothetical protein